MLFCTTCGSPTSEDQKFCTSCGTPVTVDPAAETPPPPTIALPTAPAPLSAATPLPVTPATPPEPSAPSPWSAGAPSPPRYDAETRPAPTGAGDQATIAGLPYAQRPRSDAPAGGLPQTWPPALAGPPAPAGAPPTGIPPPPGRRNGRTPASIAVAVVLLLVLAGGAVAAWKLLGHHTTQLHPTAAGSTHGTSQPGHGSPGSPAASSPTQATPSTTPTPSPSAAGGQFTVAVDPGVPPQSGLQQVVSFLQSYFTAINAHDYGQYASLVVSSLRPTPGQFQAGYGSTTDSAATLTALSPTADGMAGTVTFTSHQLPSASHTGTSCTAWRITLFLRAHGTGYRIEPPPPGYHSHSHAC